MKTLLLVAAAGGALWYFTKNKKKAGVTSVTQGQPTPTIPGITPPIWSATPSIDPKDLELTPTSNYVGVGCHSCR